jgi:hypothetical protein
MGTPEAGSISDAVRIHTKDGAGNQMSNRSLAVDDRVTYEVAGRMRVGVVRAVRSDRHPRGRTFAAVEAPAGGPLVWFEVDQLLSRGTGN